MSRYVAGGALSGACLVSFTRRRYCEEHKRKSSICDGESRQPFCYACFATSCIYRASSLRTSNRTRQHGQDGGSAHGLLLERIVSSISICDELAPDVPGHQQSEARPVAHNILASMLFSNANAVYFHCHILSFNVMLRGAALIPIYLNRPRQL